MQEIRLTREAKKDLSILYKEYNRRRYAGLSKRQAIYFDPKMADHRKFINLVKRSVQELTNAGLIKTFILGDFELTDEAIVYMEEKPLGILKKLLSFIAQFKP